jgi:hypothetical protein
LGDAPVQVRRRRHHEIRRREHAQALPRLDGHDRHLQPLVREPEQPEEPLHQADVLDPAVDG